MSTAVVTGSGGLVGSCVTRRLLSEGMRVVGIDNDARSRFFGVGASVRSSIEQLRTMPRYMHSYGDIRNVVALRSIFGDMGNEISLIVHAASQPSHDWSATDPLLDFETNALATVMLLNEFKRFCPSATFVFLSTNKVYGDAVNWLDYIEQPTRYEMNDGHYTYGIDESMSIDRTMHSPFGVSKASADLYVQEFGKYYKLNTVCFRCGCISGAAHVGTAQHGFLSYLAKCAVGGEPYTINGYYGKQVRDNLHADDLADAVWRFYKSPKMAAVYNMGGGRTSNCSVLEAIDYCNELIGRKMVTTYSKRVRTGDHIWWISDTWKFRNEYPDWNVRIDWRGIIQEIISSCRRN